MAVEKVNHFNTLPDELLLKIFKHLDHEKHFKEPSHYLIIARVCLRFKNILNDPSFKRKLIFTITNCFIAEGHPPMTIFTGATDHIKNLHIKSNIFINDKSSGKKFWQKIGESVENIEISVVNIPKGVDVDDKYGLPCDILQNFPKVKTVKFYGPNTQFIVPETVETVIFKRFQSLTSINDFLHDKPNIKKVFFERFVWNAEQSDIKLTPELMQNLSQTTVIMRYYYKAMNGLVEFKLFNQKNINYLEQRHKLIDFKDLLYVKRPMLSDPFEYNKFTNLREASFVSYRGTATCHLIHQQVKYLETLEFLQLQNVDNKICSECSKYLQRSCPNLKSISIHADVGSYPSNAYDIEMEYIFDTFADKIRVIILTFCYSYNYSEIKLMQGNFLPALELLVIGTPAYYNAGPNSKISLEFCEWKMPKLKSFSLTHSSYEEPNFLDSDIFRKFVQNTPNLMEFKYNCKDIHEKKTFSKEHVDVMKVGWTKLKKIRLKGVNFPCGKEDCVDNKCAMLYQRKVPRSYHRALKSPCFTPLTKFQEMKENDELVFRAKLFKHLERVQSQDFK